MPLQKYRIGESVTRYVFLRYRLPTAMFDGNASFVADRLEPHLDFGRLTRREACLTPCESKAHAGFPDGNSPDLEDFAIRARLSEPAVQTRFEGNHTGRRRSESEECIRPPPNPDLAYEHFECPLWYRSDAQRYQYPRSHRVRSMCALNAASWSRHSSSVCSSQAFRSAIGPGLSR